MKFSVIIPIYKVEQYLKTCVDSILEQSNKDIEVILIDDGSPDYCPKICDEMANADTRVKAIHKQNGGASSARNEGVRVAKGDYIIFLDGDDFWSDKYALERIGNIIDKYMPDVVIFGGRKYYTLDDKYTGSSSHLNAFEKCEYVSLKSLMQHSAFVACAWDKVIKRSVINDNSIYFKEGHVGEDIEWCCKLLEHDLKYCVVTGDIHVYRQQNVSSVTANIKNKNLYDIMQMIEEYTQVAINTNNEPLFHFLALEYLLWISITSHLTGEDGRNLKKQMGSYFWLLNYTWYPRVSLLSKIRFIGYRGVCMVLTMAYKLKNLIII